MNRSPAQTALLYVTVLATLTIILFPIYWLFITALASTDELSGLPHTFFPANPDWGRPRWDRFTGGVESSAPETR